MSTNRRMFGALVKRKEERIDLTLAALLIAKEEYPRLAIEDYVERLDQLAADFQVQLEIDADEPAACRSLARYLAVEHGYSGDRDTYYDPRNSYLNEVIDRRRGIPITLSVLYIEVARRAGIKLLPVSFPGHFLIKLASDTDEVFIDPFNDGRILDLEGCRALFAAAYGNDAAFSPSMLGAATKRQVISRMLLNLKRIYLQAELLDKALRTVDLLLSVSPWDLEEVRDRGLLHCRLGEVEKGIGDLQSYVDHAPAGNEVEQVKLMLRGLYQL